MLNSKVGMVVSRTRDTKRLHGEKSKVATVQALGISRSWTLDAVLWPGGRPCCIVVAVLYLASDEDATGGVNLSR